MANIASQIKRNQRSLRERAENRQYTSAVKTYFRRLQAAVELGRRTLLSPQPARPQFLTPYDAAAVIRAKPSRHELLVDQGMADPYLEQLRPGELHRNLVAGHKPIHLDRLASAEGYFRALADGLRM